VTAAWLSKRAWPPTNHRIWEQLAQRLRPDRIGPHETAILLQVLNEESTRRRVLRILRDRVEVYHGAWKEHGRGGVERILLSHIRKELNGEPADALIANVIEASDTYETAAVLLQRSFDGLIWALKQRGGRATLEILMGDKRLNGHLRRARLGLVGVVSKLDRAMDLLRDQPSLNGTEFVEPLARLREDVVTASATEGSVAQVVMKRHERVQKEKSKAPWIERTSSWTLMPGENRVSGAELPQWRNEYLHPFKIPNAYALLGDLGQVRREVHDAEE
jgi:DNA-binding transcriptional ArsR family regulator